MCWLPVQPGKIDDYTTASNICLRISNKEYCSTRLRRTKKPAVQAQTKNIDLGISSQWCKFKSSAAPLAIKSDNYAECLRGPSQIYFRYRIDKTIHCKRALSYYLE